MNQKNIQWAWRQKTQCASMKLLLVAFASQANAKGELTCLTLATLCKATQLDRKTIIKYKKALMIDGLIAIENLPNNQITLLRGEQ